MRFFMALSVCAAIGVGAASPAVAGEEAPWCAQLWGGDSDTKNCSMRSFEMCLNEIRGTGGNTLCSPNPRYQAIPAERVLRHRKAA